LADGLKFIFKASFDTPAHVDKLFTIWSRDLIWAAEIAILCQ